MSNKQSIEILDDTIEEIEKSSEWSDIENRWISYYQIISLKQAKSRIQSLPDTDEWISADNPPDDSYWYVLCYVKYLNSLWISHYMDVLSYNNWKWSKDFEENNVTHWKPLPNIPNQ